MVQMHAYLVHCCRAHQREALNEGSILAMYVRAYAQECQFAQSQFVFVQVYACASCALRRQNESRDMENVQLDSALSFAISLRLRPHQRPPRRHDYEPHAKAFCNEEEGQNYTVFPWACVHYPFCNLSCAAAIHHRKYFRRQRHTATVYGCGVLLPGESS